MKAAIDRQIAQVVGRGLRERADFTRDELDTIDGRFVELSEAAQREVFDA
jgi:hypothetical protein